MTNGDVIKRAFPNAEIKHGFYGIEGLPLVCLHQNNTKMYEASFAEEWWNAQFRGQTKWIPVTERLPEDRRAVLVTAYWHETYQVMMASYYGDGLWWCVPFNNCGEHMQKLNPKAWMPLPETYKAD